MASFSSAAFSVSGFSASAFDFDTGPLPPSVVLLGGGGYVHPYAKHREEEYQRRLVAEKHAEIRRIDEEIAEAERQRQAAQKRARARLIEKRAAMRLAMLERRLQEEINVLRIERARLMRLIDDEEAILVLLLSQPFH